MSKPTRRQRKAASEKDRRRLAMYGKREDRITRASRMELEAVERSVRNRAPTPFGFDWEVIKANRGKMIE